MADPLYTVLRYAEIDWDDALKNIPSSVAPPKELVEKARKQGARRKKIVRGEAGFYMNRSTFSPGFEVPPHSHDHSELLIVLRGGCRFYAEEEAAAGGAELAADDAIVIQANARYGFTCGPEGMEFLTIRTGEARVDLSA